LFCRKMISLLLGSALGLAVRNQPQQQSLQASSDPAASPAASPAAQAQQAQGAGVDWASGAKLPEGAIATPLAPVAEPAVPAVAVAPTATAVAPVAPVAEAVAPVVPDVPVQVQPEAPIAPTAVAVAPMAADGTQPTIATEACVSIQPGTSDYWCSATCASSVCPEAICKCGDGAQQQAAAKVDAAIASHQENEQKVKDAAEAMATSPLPVAPVAPEALPVDSDHADAEAKVKEAMESKKNEDAALPASSIMGAHDDAEQKVKDAMGATVDEIKDKVATDNAATSPAPAVVAPAAVAPAEQQAQAKPAGKVCTALVATATDMWCQNTCSEVPSQIVAVTPTSYCPKDICSCK